MRRTGSVTTQIITKRSPTPVAGPQKQSTTERPYWPALKKVHDTTPGRRRDSSKEKSEVHHWKEGACRVSKEKEKE
ncbi:hypothetical protein NDU88_007103, partial [Pleurodeles waltl]